MRDAGRPVVWIVASAGAAERWAGAFADAGVSGLPLAWGRVRAVGEPSALEARLCAGPWAFVLLTSPNAVSGLVPGGGSGQSAVCVGAATAAAARAVGFEVSAVGAGTGADLAATLIADRSPGRVLWLRGRDVVSGAERRLRTAGFEVVSEVTYEVGADDDFAARVRDAPPPAAVAVGSPRGARALDSALGAAAGSVKARPALAVGSTTADALRALGFSDVRVPARPDAAELARLACDVV